MAWARRLAACALALAPAGCETAGQCRLSLATTLPITVAHDGEALLVPARLGDRTLSLIVDTGATLSLIRRQALPRYQDMRGTAVVGGIGGSEISDITQLQQLTLGRLRGAVPAAVSDAGFVIDGQEQDGLLGMDVMGNYEVDLDVPGRQLRLYETSGDCSQPAAALQQPLYAVPEPYSVDRDVQPRIEVTIHGQSFRALIDSGSPTTALFASAAKRLGLDAAAMANDRKTFARGVGRATEQAHRHVMDVIEIGQLDLGHVPVAVIDEDLPSVDLLLGMDLLQRVHVWLSASSHTVVLQLPPRPSPPL